MFLVALTYAFTHVFSGRGAFTQIGAVIGTIMVANVFVIIIPYQKKTVAAMLAGKEPDPRWGELGKQRSVHNNYLTLPVVFLMLSNHYPLFFATRFNWLIVAIVLVIGPLIRHFFNSRHEGKGNPWWTWGVAAAGMAAVAWLSAAGPRITTDRRIAAAAEIRRRRRHRHVPLQHVPRRRTGLGRASPAAPEGVLLDTDEQIRLHAPLIEIVAVRSNAMPPGNITEMTNDERLDARLVARVRRAGEVNARDNGDEAADVERAGHSRPASDLFARAARRRRRAKLSLHRRRHHPGEGRPHRSGRAGGRVGGAAAGGDCRSSITPTR